MRYTIEITSSAHRELRALPSKMRERIAAKIEALGHNPFPPDVKKLKGEPAHFRVRVGDYRVIYRVHGDVLVIVIVRVAHRREAYR
jgi:mRNA interferase RelE/StbE